MFTVDLISLLLCLFINQRNSKFSHYDALLETLNYLFLRVDSLGSVDFLIDKFLVKHQFHDTILGDGKSAAVPRPTPVP